MIRTQGIAPVVEPTLARWLTPRFVADHPARAQEVRNMISATSVEGFIGAAEALKTLDYRRRLKDIRLPALFVAAFLALPILALVATEWHLVLG